jgi:hypothetical protein
MKPRLLLQFIPCLLLAGEAVAEDTSAKLIQNPRILYSSTVRNGRMVGRRLTSASSHRQRSSSRRFMRLAGGFGSCGCAFAAGLECHGAGL